MSSKRIHAVQTYSFTVLYEPTREGGYKITVPLLPGLISYGRNFDEAREMAQDSIKCYIGALKKEHEEIPSEHFILQERRTVVA